MVILNSLKLLNELSQLEEKINNIKDLCIKNGIHIDEEELLEKILNHHRQAS